MIEIFDPIGQWRHSIRRAQTTHALPMGFYGACIGLNAVGIQGASLGRVLQTCTRHKHAFITSEYDLVETLV